MATARLSRERIVAAAITIADTSGLDAVTMRGVARSLGVEAMSLYHHVDDRRTLVAAAAETAWLQIEPVTEGDWLERLTTNAELAYELLIERPWLLDVASAAGGRGRMRLIDAFLAALADAGLDEEELTDAYHLLDALILGYAVQQSSYRGGGGGEVPADLPHVLAHADAHVRGIGTTPALGVGLDALVRRVRRLTA